MSQVAITLKLNPREYELVRDSLETARDDYKSLSNDSHVDAKTRKAARERSAELALLRSKV